MNRAISWLQNVVVRLVLTLSLVGITFFSNASLDNRLAVHSKPLTPEATKDQVNSDDSPFRENDQEKVNQLFQENKNPQTAPQPVEKLGDKLTKPQKTIKKNLESAVDTARKKLNFD